MMNISKGFNGRDLHHEIENIFVTKSEAGYKNLNLTLTKFPSISFYSKPSPRSSVRTTMAIMNRRTSLIVLILIAALLPLLISTKNLKPELTSQVLEPHQLKEGDLIPLFASKVFQRADGW